MKGKYNKFGLICVAIGVLILPFLALLTAQYCFGKTIYDNPDFWYGYMGYFGTVVLASVALLQTQESIKLSNKFDEMNARQNYSMAVSINKFNIFTSYNENSAISFELHDDKAAEAIMLIEHTEYEEAIPFDEFVMEFYYQDYSKAAIKSFDLIVNQMAFIQETSHEGLEWTDGHSGKVLVGVRPILSNSTSPIWIGDDKFKIILKLYAPHHMALSQMIENGVSLSLIMSAELESVCGIITRMKYKYWFTKGVDGICLERTESQIISI